MENVLGTEAATVSRDYSAWAKKATFVVLELVFFGSIYVVSTQAFTMPIWLIVLACFACFRGAKTISENEIMEGLREPFTKVVPDSSGAGAGVHPKGKGIQYAIGSLLACPICSGTWMALVLVAAYTLFPQFGTVLIVILAVAGVSELLYGINEFFCWGGRLSRVRAGEINPDGE